MIGVRNYKSANLAKVSTLDIYQNIYFHDIKMQYCPGTKFEKQQNVELEYWASKIFNWTLKTIVYVGFCCWHSIQLDIEKQHALRLNVPIELHSLRHCK